MTRADESLAPSGSWASASSDPMDDDAVLKERRCREVGHGEVRR
jgi:hypothetical protein